MKRRGMSTRVGAVILAASMVVGDAVPTLAAQTAGTEVPAATMEVTETEATESAETTEAAEKKSTEATETTETTEVTEVTEEEEATEVTEEEEATEVTEDAADAEEVTAEDVVLGDEVGVSTVIGLEGDKSTDGTFRSDDKKVTKEYSYVNKAQSEDSSITVAGKAADKKDAATGLYKYNDTYYGYGYDRGDGTCSLSGKVVKTFTDAPKTDAETGLYLIDGKYYSGLGNAWNEEDTKVLCYFVTTSSEVDVLGTISVTDTQDKDTVAETAYGKKVADTDSSVSYYEANGKDYTYVNTENVSTGKYTVYASKSSEISFTKHHQHLSWNDVTNDTEIEQNGKLYHIGYQVKVNGTAAKLDSETADGQTFTTVAGFGTTGVYADGEQNTYEVRAVYYTVTETAVKNDKDVVTGYKEDYVIAKTGAWSAAYAYANEGEKQLQEVPAVTGLTVAKKKNNNIELNWSEVPAASDYYVYSISSDKELTLTDEDWEKAYSLKWGSQYDEDDNFLYCLNFKATRNTYMTDSLSNYKYHYYRVKAYIDYENDTYETGFGKASDVVSAIADEVSSDAVTVTGFSAEAQTDGTYNLKWDELPSSTEVYIYYTTDKNALSNNNYLLGLINATGTYVYDTEDGDTETVSYTDDDKVSEAYQIAQRKVHEEGTYNGDEGTGDGVSVRVPANKTYYFVAVTVSDKNYNTDRSATTPYVGTRLNSENKEVTVKYGNYNDVAASAVISATGVLARPDKPDTKSEKTSITMTFDKQSGATGYEIYKKNNKGKYKKIATTTSAQYVDKNLKTGTTYSYKARAYAYNTVTKKKAYSDYVAFSAETSISNYIDVTAAMTGKNAVKVKWTKVTGAIKYEVYRSSTASTDDVYSSSNKYGTKSNAKWKLVKTINKAKTVSYTDKKLNAGETYSYQVVAYYKDGKETKTIKDAASVTLRITAPENVKAVLSKSKVKVTWDKNAYAKKYEVRYTKYNSQGKAYTEEPVVTSTKKTAVTISGLTTGDYVSSVQVRAYDGKKWSDWSNGNGNGRVSLAAVKSVSAKNVSVKDANGVASSKVQVSWKAVSGAAYYEVYRSTSPARKYNKDQKTYYGLNGYEMIAKESNRDEASWANEVYYDEYKGQPGTIVGTTAIDGGQLQSGVTYYYFVVAYSENGRVASAGYANKGAAVIFNAAPSIKSAKAKGGKVTVSINKVAGAKKYVVYRSTKKNKGFVAVGTTKKTSYVDKKVKKGKTYYYKVVAVGTNALQADFETEMSSAVKVKAK